MTSKTVLHGLKPSYFWQIWCPKYAPRGWLPRVLASSLELLECAGTSRPKFQHRCSPYNYPRYTPPLASRHMYQHPLPCNMSLVFLAPQTAKVTLPQAPGAHCKRIHCKRHNLIATGTAKSRGSHLLGAHFGHHTCQKYEGFSSFKTALLVILGLLKFVQNSPIKLFGTCYYCPIGLMAEWHSV